MLKVSQTGSKPLNSVNYSARNDVVYKQLLRSIKRYYSVASEEVRKE